MLDQETKRKIDSARQILVGKIPDPKAQVEQITTALIYKFMDDMDKESQEMGGKASFFVGDFAQYAWTKIMDSRLSGQDRMNLYVEAITKLAREVHIPLLFRNIFKDSFLPFRDERTVGLFLKEIDGFRYDHSEDLGDAYEYLLSILDSQGDAGQFRTPRHIIDFIVKVINPQKNETILDPACGTAGFLISSYKHIWAQNKEKPLTPDEKKKLMGNVTGYDISPDMVKLALVNLYLHGFSSPEIYEYDTLTDQRRWDDYFDVILTNPPFMTPKGGIRPHNRFSIQAKRSEVLFVDYIAEHLSMRGRAGIIVPEGIIFQAANAYKSLRKNLLENWGLYGVVSLPSGIFQPYSGVKTSILLLDRELAKRTNDIVFVKVENDGYDLGAQRKESEKNDLPDCLHALQRWKRERTIDEGNRFAFAVSRTKIAADGAYNLTGDRYRETVDYSNTKRQMVELGEVCSVLRGTSITKKEIITGDIPVIAGGKQPAYYHNQANRKGEIITVSGSGAYAGFVNFFQIPIFASDCSTIQSLDKSKLSTDFVFYVLKRKQDEIYKMQSGMGQPHVYAKDLKKIKIPLPPLEVQEQIVAELELYQKVIDGAKQVVASWKPSFRIDPNWQMVALGELLEYEQPSDYLVESTNYKDEYKIPVLTAGKSFLLGYTNEKGGIFPRNNLPVIIFDDFTTAIQFVDFPFKVKSSAMKILRAKKGVNIRLVFYMMQNIKFDASQHKRYWISQYSKIKIPLPPLEVQEHIVAEIDAERQTIDGNKALIETMQKKIEAKISELWD